MTRDGVASAPSEVRHAVRSGLAWGTVARGVQLVAQFAGTAILARLLTPGDFGLVNMAAIFLNVANALADFGVRAYVLHRRDLDDAQVESAKLVSWGLGLAIFLLACVAAFPMAWFYREPRLAPILVVQAVVYVIVNAGTVHGAMLARRLSFHRIAQAEIASSVAYVAASTALALFGAGYWSMVVGRVIGSLAALVVVSAGLRGILPRRAAAGEAGHSRRILRFGGIVAGTGVLTQLDENFDNIVVGRFMGAGSLGLYAVAYNLAALPQKYLAFMIAGIANPVVAGAPDGASLGGVLRRYVRYQVLVPAAIAVGIGLMAPEVVAVLLGSRWPAAAPLVRIMSFSTAMLAVATVVGGSLVSRGHARELFAFHVVKLAVTMTGVAIGAAYGVVGIAYGFLGAVAITLVLGLKFVEARLHVSGVLRAIVAPCLLVGVAAAPTWFLRAWLVTASASHLVVLIAAGAAYAAILLAVALAFLPEVRTDLAVALRDRRGKGARTSAT